MFLILNDLKGIIFPIKSIAIQVLIFCLISFVFTSTNVNAADAVSYFKENKEDIMAALQKDYDAKKFQAVIDAASKYAEVEDADLKKITSESKRFLGILNIINTLKKLSKVNTEDKDKKIKLYQKLNTLILDSEIGKKLWVYNSLLSLDPNNKQYQDKITHFKKAAEEKRAELLAKIKEAEETQGSPLTKYVTMGVAYAELAEIFPENKKYKERAMEIKTTMRGFLASGITEWNIATTKSAKNSLPNIMITVVSFDTIANNARPALVLACQENTTLMFINWQTFISTNNSPMTYRVDSKKAKTDTFYIAGNQGLGYLSGEKAIPFIKSLFGGSKLTVQVFPDRGENLETVTFNIKNIETVIKPLRESCHW